MFEKISHVDGLQVDKEILFSTAFDYFFPDAARSGACLLPASEATVAALRELGSAMADPGDSDTDSLDSTTPAIYTYFGQFIDHDITARTDRDTSASFIGRNEPIAPRDPDEVVASLRNGRRPQLDLDSVFGDGPALAGGGGTVAPVAQSNKLYDTSLRLKTFDHDNRRDLVRGDDRGAIIPDQRNDENLNISQLQFAFLTFYNAVYAAQTGSTKRKHIPRAAVDPLGVPVRGGGRLSQDGVRLQRGGRCAGQWSALCQLYCRPWRRLHAAGVFYSRVSFRTLHDSTRVSAELQPSPD